MHPVAEQPTLISSVRRALHLLDAVAASPRPATAKALSRATCQPLPTTYHLLRTLVHEGYLRRVDGGYVIGAHVATLGTQARAQLRTERMRTSLQDLHDQLRAAAYLTLYQDGEIRLLDVVDSSSAPRVDLWVDLRDSGHATALGKAVLGALDPLERADYLDRHRLPDLTPYTLTDERELVRRLEHQHGPAVDRQEYSLGTACVATPLRIGMPEGVVVGAVAVSVPSARLARTLLQVNALISTARSVELALVG